MDDTDDITMGAVNNGEAEVLLIKAVSDEVGCGTGLEAVTVVVTGCDCHDEAVYESGEVIDDKMDEILVVLVVVDDTGVAAFVMISCIL